MITPQNERDKYMVASQVADNIQSEWEAVSQYYLLLQWLKEFGDEESIGHVEEIISDEKNHAMLLRKIVRKYDGDIPVAKD
jgi:ferritin-like metal-binding protein YciE